MKHVTISGTGSYLPSKRVSNDDLAERLDTSDEWIFTRSGIRARRVVSDDETTSSMAIAAGKRALEDAKLKPEDIDMVIVGTCTPDRMFPSTACLVQHALGIRPVPSFDVLAACSGFVYILDIAYQYIRNGAAKNILIIGSEVMSRTLDWNDRSTCVLFGDGAGAMVLSVAEKPGVMWTQLGADGCYQDFLSLPNALFENTNKHVQMAGSEVYKVAVRTLEDIVHKAMLENNLEKGQIDWLIPHQANVRIIQAVAKRLGISMEQVVLTIEEQANTSAASIPLALDEAIRDGRVKRGQLLLLEAFGGGFTWGAALIKY